MDDSKKSNVEPLTQSGRAVMEAFERFERRLWNFSKIIWTFSLLLPIALTAIVVGLIAMIQGPKAAYSFVIAAIATATLFGRFIILFGQSPETVVAEYEPGSFWYEMLQELSKVSSVELFLLVMYLDLVVASFLAFHLGFIFKVPYVGPKIADLMGDTQTLLHEQPWVKHASVFALIVFVMFPTSTTGSVGGSIFGRLMGLSRMTTFGAIALGSFLGNGLMYLLAEQINRYVDKDDWWLKFVGIVFCLLLVIFLERRYRHMQNVARKEREKQAGAPAEKN